MSETTLETSRAPGGPHHLLAQWVGRYEGTTTVYLEPEKAADTSPWKGEARLLLGGRFLEIAYQAGFQGQVTEGVLLVGFHLSRRSWELAWMDTWHTGTALQLGRGGADGRVSALAFYGDGQGGPDWGWRTAIFAPDARHLTIEMHNIGPDGATALAVSTVLARR
jgi:hypothetical protein